MKIFIIFDLINSILIFAIEPESMWFEHMKDNILN